MADPRIAILGPGDLFPEAKIPVLTAAKIPNLPASKVTSGTFSVATAPAGTVFTAPLNGTISTNANLARPSSRTDIFFIWNLNTTVPPANAIAGDKWDLVVP